MFVEPEHPWLSPETDRLLREALLRQAAGRADAAEPLKKALGQVGEEGHRGGLTAEHVVMALRITWSRVPRPKGMTPDAWADVYKRVVADCLALY